MALAVIAPNGTHWNLHEHPITYPPAHAPWLQQVGWVYPEPALEPFTLLRHNETGRMYARHLANGTMHLVTPSNG